MLLAVLLILAQDQAPPPASVAGADVANPQRDASGAQRWSIKTDPCAAERGGPDEIVVCGERAGNNPRLPLPEERGPPDHAVPGNPEATGAGALAMTATPCRAKIGGCPGAADVFGAATFVVRAIGKVIDPQSCCDEPGEATNPGMLIRDVAHGVSRTFKKKDKRPRIPIPLDDPALVPVVAIDPSKPPAP